ncbi:ABC transporter permease [Spirosoma sp. BT702]|uniref:ABC transporter permease n=1 Tax=Spirosoma profusum TaxID=2771354 RepID=A0A927ANQ4_9BACT|nr:ABC transporter permease [Spirosoma profusum]MBD2702314.1 ABC transporter permease [Spirosoma profusum]
MLRTYFKIAWRNLVSNKLYSSLNLAGLSIGLTCFAFIALWIQDEWSFDRFNENADRIYRVASKIIGDSETFEHAVSAVPLGPALKADYPEVEQFVRFDPSDAVVKRGDRVFVEEGILLTDPSFFDTFSYSMTVGDPKTALTDPYSIVLTESMAKKYFGQENPVGQNLTIMLNDSTGKGVPYRITGIMPDAPKNAHVTFSCLVSFETLIAYNRADLAGDGAWGNNSYYTYILLKKGVDYKAFAAKLPQFYDRHVLPINQRYGVNKRTAEYQLMPLTDIHLKSNVRYEISAPGSLTNLYIFGTVCLFILLLAGINYMNLATARSLKRAKEVGVKKVMGALKGQLVGQYLLESVILAVGALGIALLLCYGLQSAFAQLTQKEIAVFQSPVLLAFLVGIALLVGLGSGLYPAFFISSYQPTTVLKGSLATSGKGVWLRKTLVVAQFSITIVLLVGILVINAQRSFIANKNLGFQKDALLQVKVNGDIDVQRRIEPFKNDLLKSQYVKNLTTSNSILVGGLGNNGMETVDNRGKKLQTSIFRLRVDYDYLATLGMHVVAGRYFSKNFPTDNPTDSTQNFIINEAAVKAFGWSGADKAIGKPFSMGGRRGQVVGVVNDFHFNSLQHKVEPLAMVIRDFGFSRIILNIDGQKPQEAIAELQAQWKKHFPTAYLDYDFVDKKLGEQYEAEARFSTIFLYFSLISVLIACLGLYGLTTFTAEQRTKEIGVRKVLGASVASVALLLSKDFLKLVGIAIVIATPMAWYAMNRWLADFAYRIDMQWWVFAVAGLLAVGIALLTVSFQSIKAALMNPVKSLRSE